MNHLNDDAFKKNRNMLVNGLIVFWEWLNALQ